MKKVSFTETNPIQTFNKNDSPNDLLGWKMKDSYHLLALPTPADYIKLSSIKLNKGIITGYVLVKNLAFQKEIIIRFSTDQWKSFQEVDAKFNITSYNNYDSFTFHLSLDEIFKTQLENFLKRKTSFTKEQETPCISFCIRYFTDNVTYWDNNEGKNYLLHFSFPTFSRTRYTRSYSDSFIGKIPSENNIVKDIRTKPAIQQTWKQQQSTLVDVHNYTNKLKKSSSHDSLSSGHWKKNFSPISSVDAMGSSIRLKRTTFEPWNNFKFTKLTTPCESSLSASNVATNLYFKPCDEEQNLVNFNLTGAKKVNENSQNDAESSLINLMQLSTKEKHLSAFIKNPETRENPDSVIENINDVSSLRNFAVPIQKLLIPKEDGFAAPLPLIQSNNAMLENRKFISNFNAEPLTFNKSNENTKVNFKTSLLKEGLEKKNNSNPQVKVVKIIKDDLNIMQSKKDVYNLKNDFEKDINLVCKENTVSEELYSKGLDILPLCKRGASYSHSPTSSSCSSVSSLLSIESTHSSLNRNLVL
ncbi:protein phosphatase 1, regulatory subunit [Lobulomyces angularis]|nr:protein phosphatase 1, regulatory subunit [Lobulomyces angularis]